jgi:hypothetical protein
MTRPYGDEQKKRKPGTSVTESGEQLTKFPDASNRIGDTGGLPPLVGLAHIDLGSSAPNHPELQMGRPAVHSTTPGRLSRLRRAEGSQSPVLPVTPSKPATVGVIRRAGHKDAWTPTKDGRFIIKITTKAEADTYAEAGQTGIQGIIPGRIGQLNSYADIAQFGPVRTLRQPTATERIIVIENLAQKGAKFDAPQSILDAKIGFITASQTQAAEEGVMLPGFKSARHYFIDSWMYDSRQQGYRFEDGQDWIDMVKNFSKTGRYSDMEPAGLHPKVVALMLDKVCRDLLIIHASMVSASITFLGSSVLIVISPSNPGASMAKAIDFAHPIKASDEPPERFEKYRKNYTEGLAGLIRDLREIQKDLNGVRYLDELSLATTAVEMHDVL